MLGATPAGYAAAHWLANKRCNVILIDAPRQLVECPLADWVPREFFRLAGLPKSLAKTSGAAEF
ncbi:MAG: hypothetical protein KAU28_05355, partial [Phycisphaerae bacterium]|nr:hypothetical protein [Phycisphaerae bacterium]